LIPMGVALNREKTKIVNTLTDAAFGFLGFDLRRVRKREKDGYLVLMTPKKKARKAIKAKIREIIAHGGALTVEAIVKKINAALAGWVNYFRVGNSNRAFSEVRDYVEPSHRSARMRGRRSSIGTTSDLCVCRRICGC
jgi:RNA-directed DNA polymerase